jgi:hypothetical protein
LQTEPAGFTGAGAGESDRAAFSRGRTIAPATVMDWEAPSFVEIRMDAELTS